MIAFTQKFFRNAQLHIKVAVIVLCGIILAAFFGSAIASLITSTDTVNLNLTLSPPDRQHWLGTDELGRDVFVRVLIGAKAAFFGPVVVAFGAVILGNAIGLIAGYKGGVTDTLAMSWVDLMFSLPWLLVAIVVVGVAGGGYWSAAVLLIVFLAPSTVRLVRGAMLEERRLPYVEAVEILALSDRRIIIRHILPNLVPIIVADAFLKFAYALVAFSSLSFLGLGVPPGAADWGRMLAEARTLVLANPGTALGPGFMLVLTAASAIFVGEEIFRQFEQRGGKS